MTDGETPLALFRRGLDTLDIALRLTAAGKPTSEAADAGKAVRHG